MRPIGAPNSYEATSNLPPNLYFADFARVAPKLDMEPDDFFFRLQAELDAVILKVFDEREILDASTDSMSQSSHDAASTSVPFPPPNSRGVPSESSSSDESWSGSEKSSRKGSEKSSQTKYEIREKEVHRPDYWRTITYDHPYGPFVHPLLGTTWEPESPGQRPTPLAGSYPSSTARSSDSDSPPPQNASDGSTSDSSD